MMPDTPKKEQIIADLAATERRAINRLTDRWGNCPDCNQSATGMYYGQLGCKRCGWSEGGVKLRPSVF